MEPIRQIIKESVARAWQLYLKEYVEPSIAPEYVYYGLGVMQAYAIKKSGMMKRGQGNRISMK